MARQIFEVNPLTKVKTWYDYDEQTDQALFYHEQDVEPLLEYTKAHRNANAKDHGIKSGFWHYAEIPAIVIYQLRNKGIDVFNRDHIGSVLKEIKENYPYLKMTAKQHQSND